MFASSHNQRSSHDAGLGLAYRAGHSLLEMLVVVAIGGLLASISAWGFFTLKNKVSERNFLADISSALGGARMRALSRQHNVVFIFDTGANPAYYEFDDTSATQNLNTQGNLAVAAAAFSYSAANYGLPLIFSVSLLATGSGSGTTVTASTRSWGGNDGGTQAFPYPHGAISVDTSAGCTFCTANRGAVAFRPDGRVVFSAVAAAGGAIVLGDTSNVNGGFSHEAIFITLNGYSSSARQ
jgi:prepilin-type N-terminal cleavage/methylation domain-containing protein